ncbi:MAG: hypothetical protein ACYTF0_03820, partial [Planctomycetota bacterium]
MSNDLLPWIRQCCPDANDLVAASGSHQHIQCWAVRNDLGHIVAYLKRPQRGRAFNQEHQALSCW